MIARHRVPASVAAVKVDSFTVSYYTYHSPIFVVQRRLVDQTRFGRSVYNGNGQGEFLLVVHNVVVYGIVRFCVNIDFFPLARRRG